MFKALFITLLHCYIVQNFVYNIVFVRNIVYNIVYNIVKLFETYDVLNLEKKVAVDFLFVQTVCSLVIG